MSTVERSHTIHSLRFHTRTFLDLQEVRIGVSNRYKATVDPALVIAPQIDDELSMEPLTILESAEKAAVDAMSEALEELFPEIADWAMDTPGMGIPSVSRLIGITGDPAVALPYHWEGTGGKRHLVADEPYRRTLAQFWQYCGHGRPGRRMRGMSVEDAIKLGNPDAKVATYLMAISGFKRKTGPFREIYDMARLRYVNRVHAAVCVRCGPANKPAQIGSPWNAGHQHAAALRLVGKEILRELWLIRQP